MWLSRETSSDLSLEKKQTAHAPEWPSTYSQSVNLLSKLAGALGHRGGGGLPPGSLHHRQRDGSKCVCVSTQQ